MSTSVTNIQNRLHSGEYGVNIVAFSNEIATPTDPSDLEHSAFTRLSDINEELSKKTRLHKIPVNLLLFTEEDPAISLSNADLIDLLGCNASEFESSFANTEVVFSVQEKKYTQPKTFAVLSEYTKDNTNVHRFVGIDGNLTIVLSFLIAENQQHVVQYTEGFLEVHETETTVTDAVKYTQQSLTAEQLAQARLNIGVTSIDVQDGSITTSKLANGAVTGAKIAEGTITSENLAPGIEIPHNITDGSVTTAKLHDGAVTSAKLDSSIANAVSAVSGKQDQLVSGTNIKTVNSQSLLGSGNILIPEQIQSNWDQTNVSAVDYIKNKPTSLSAFTNDSGYLTNIPDNAVTTSKIADNSIITQKLSSEVLTLLNVSGASGNNSILTMGMEYTDDEILTVRDDLQRFYRDLDAGKADVATTLSGYNITDAYTKAAVDSMIAALLPGKDFVVTEGPLPNPGETNTIYRLKGVNSYSDNMYYDGNWIELATYNNAIDNVPKKNSENIITSGGVFDNIDAIDVSVLNKSNDIPTKYSSLTNAISAISSDYLKGGITIKYIEDISNEYKWYKLLTNTWSSNVNDWSILPNDTINYNNQEWIRAITDKEGKVLCGIKTDGAIEWSVGIPTPIKDKIESSSDKIDVEINKLDNNKVDKEEGKSLIDVDVAELFSIEDNPEFLKFVTDSENKLLTGIKKDGKVWMNALHTKDIDIENSVNAKGGFSTKDFVIEVVKNPEFSTVYIDADDKVLFGIHADGSKYLGKELPSVYNQKTIRNLGLKPLTIAFVGDSIVEGYGSSDYNGGASGTSGHLIPNNVKTWYRNTGENCWVNKIINHLTTNYSNVVAVNNGIGGLRVSQVCANLPTIAVDDFGNKADVVIFSAGTNDRNESDKDNSITSCIKSTKDWCDRNNIQLIVLTNTPLMNTVKPNNDYTVSSAIKKACEIYNIQCVDLFSNMIYYIEDKNISLASIMNDNLHPNDAGYEIIYRLVKKLLKI